MEILPIRDAVLGDVPDLAELFVRSSLSSEDHPDQLLRNPGTLEFSDVAVREGRTRVVTIKGRIVGFATTLVRRDAVELEDLFVDPDWIGRGLGRRLVLDVVAIACQHRIARVEVTANNGARGFYAKIGFVFDHQVETQFGLAPRLHLDISLDTD